MMEMFYSSAAQYDSYKPLVAIEMAIVTKEVNFEFNFILLI